VSNRIKRCEIMRKSANTSNERSGFTLAEILAALVVGSMILIVVLAIYSRAQDSAAALTEQMNGSRLPAELLQRIAEDLDKVTASGSDTKITLERKLQSGFSVVRFEIIRTVADDKGSTQELNKITWQSNLDPTTGTLIIYRSHSGLAMEDNLLGKQKQLWQRDVFVPVCDGATLFKIRIPKGEDYLDRWTSNALPNAVVVTVSFAEPYKAVDGTWDVPAEDAITRTIAIDRTRKIKFTVAKPESPTKAQQAEDQNEPQPQDLPAESETEEPNER